MLKDIIEEREAEAQKSIADKISECDGGWSSRFEGMAHATPLIVQTPTLKEQLLDEIYRLHEIYDIDDIPHINKEVVKAIINRLIP
jgi:hypothetical protein